MKEARVWQPIYKKMANDTYAEVWLDRRFACRRQVVVNRAVYVPTVCRFPGDS